MNSSCQKQYEKIYKRLLHFSVILALSPMLVACSTSFSNHLPKAFGIGALPQQQNALAQNEFSAKRSYTSSWNNSKNYRASAENINESFNVTRSEDDLKQEFQDHRQAISLVQSAERNAADNATVTAKLKDESQNAQLRAVEAARIAKNEQEKTNNLKLKFEEQNSRSSVLQAERERAYRNAIAIEKRAMRRTVNLRNSMNKTRANHEQALDAVRKAQQRAEAMKKAFASRQKLMNRSQLHEKSLLSGR